MFHAKKYGARMYTAEFSGHKHYGNGDMIILVCHLIFQDHIIKGPYDFIGSSPISSVTILLRLVPISIVVVEI